MIDLNELSRTSYATAERHHKNGGNIRTDTSSMLRRCATEVVEATEAYVNSMVRYGSINQQFADELSDILYCVLIVAGKEEIDVEKALTSCIEKKADKTGGKS